MENEEQKEFLTTAEAAERLGVHVVTMRNWRRRNFGPEPLRHQHNPMRIVYRASDIEAFEKSWRGEK